MAVNHKLEKSDLVALLTTADDRMLEPLVETFHPDNIHIVNDLFCVHPEWSVIDEYHLMHGWKVPHRITHIPTGVGMFSLNGGYTLNQAAKRADFLADTFRHLFNCADATLLYNKLASIDLTKQFHDYCNAT